MKKFILSLLILFFTASLVSFSQDVIFKKDGAREEVKVILIGDKEIQYKKFNNPEGPVYTVSKDKITLITFENGDYEMFGNQPGNESKIKEDLTVNFARNIIKYHLFDVIYGDFTFSYERIFASGTIGLSIPVGLGYAYNSDYYNSSDNMIKNMFYSGIGINIYPTGQGKWRYFVGPNVRIGYGKQSYWMAYWDEWGNWMGEEEEVSEGIYTKFFVDNGVVFTPVRNFSVSVVGSVGVRFFPEASYSYNTFMPSGSFMINIGYRF